MTDSQLVLSPIDLNSETVCLETIEINSILERYKREYHFDVSSYFVGLNEIQVRRCESTHYRFYYPFQIQAGQDLYTALQNFDFYYLKNRWEFNEVAQRLKKGQTLVEFGCGNGDALEIFKNKGLDVLGIETNLEAVKICHNKNIAAQSIDFIEWSSKHNELYDVVCAFHLLEHMCDVNLFFQSAKKLLKPGGKLMISVPNNDSFGHIHNSLNLPPHHMGLWNKDSLERTGRYFGLKPTHIQFAPLEASQRQELYPWLRQRMGQWFFGFRSLSRFPKFFAPFVPKRLTGYTILIEFTKP